MPQPVSSSSRPAAIEPGSRVSVTQQIPQRDEVWTISVVGTAVKTEQKKTGSWYAHSKDDKLWLDRLTIRKDDGEIVVCNLDQFSHVEVIAPPVSATPVEESDSTAAETTTESDDQTDADSKPADAADAADVTAD